MPASPLYRQPCEHPTQSRSSDFSSTLATPLEIGGNAAHGVAYCGGQQMNVQNKKKKPARKKYIKPA
jgi:hypothetical protein